ncbi:aminoglycoside adenylyltransferase family protein [Vibrio sp. WXL103]|uniref:aminoglycoside adenylyltransferase family protein n=1 Tax=Vibrio sp. WXL103 TaxID=3450710 RepID=UPI003EC570E7
MNQNSLPQEAKQAKGTLLELFSNSVVGIYLFGSAVMGGLKPNSDVDLLVVLDREPTVKEKEKLASILLDISGSIGNSKFVRPLEVSIVTRTSVDPVIYPPRLEFIYGEWLRESFEKGHIDKPCNEADLAIVLKKVLDSSLTLSGLDAYEVIKPIPMNYIYKAVKDSLPGLVENFQGDERNVLLTLARMWFTLVNDKIVSKDAAAQWVEGMLEPDQSAMMRYARLGYLGEVSDIWEDKQEQAKGLVDSIKHSIELAEPRRANNLPQ